MAFEEESIPLDDLRRTGGEPFGNGSWLEALLKGRKGPEKIAEPRSFDAGWVLLPVPLCLPPEWASWR